VQPTIEFPLAPAFWRPGERRATSRRIIDHELLHSVCPVHTACPPSRWFACSVALFLLELSRPPQDDLLICRSAEGMRIALPFHQQAFASLTLQLTAAQWQAGGCPGGGSRQHHSSAWHRIACSVALRSSAARDKPCSQHHHHQSCLVCALGCLCPTKTVNPHS
jgi:hypothetical protein